MKKYCLCLLIICSLAVTGCGFFAVTKDKAGVEHTQIGDISKKIGEIAPIINALPIPPIVPAIPGIKLLIGLILGTVSTVGGLISSVLIAKKRGGTLNAVIKGVELASNDDTKSKIKEVAGALGYEPYLNKLVKATTGT